MRTFIYPYNSHSASARNLANALGCRRIRTSGSRYRHNPNDHLVVNWGSTTCPVFENMLNKPTAVSLAASKVDTLGLLDLSGVSVPHFTRHKEVAEDWLNRNVFGKVYCRTLTRANSGRGIVVANSAEEIVDAPLYVAGITGGRREYRVHVFNGEVIRLQQKKRRTTTADEGYEANDDVRNLGGGWVFTSENITPLSDSAIQDAIKAVEVLGLDFGAVDVVTRQGSHWVLEVNTACGLEGTTLDCYVDAINKHLNPLEEVSYTPETPEDLFSGEPDYQWVTEPTPRVHTSNLAQWDVGKYFRVGSECPNIFEEGSIIKLISVGTPRLFQLISGHCGFNNMPDGSAGAYFTGHLEMVDPETLETEPAHNTPHTAATLF